LVLRHRYWKVGSPSVFAAPSLKYQAALSIAYGTGLRVSEVIALKVGDIDSQRMTLRVEQGKRNKDRYAMLEARIRIEGGIPAASLPSRLYPVLVGARRLLVDDGTITMAINGANSWGRQSMDVQYALQLVETRTRKSARFRCRSSHWCRLRNGVSCAPTPLVGKVVASQGTSDAACRGRDATRFSGRRLNLRHAPPLHLRRDKRAKDHAAPRAYLWAGRRVANPG
jgi:hypothetical protein